jgi:hypothetical protein
MSRVRSPCVAVLAVLCVLGCAPRPYQLGPGRTLRAVLEGRWDWSTNSRPCRYESHRIAFLENGRVLTITPIGRDSVPGEPFVTTYDIIDETPSSLTGAIRGERRVARNGELVRWELILVSANRYVWRRTDLGSAATSAPILRCP